VLGFIDTVLQLLDIRSLSFSYLENLKNYGKIGPNMQITIHLMFNILVISVRAM
jgi:hypothetical protein